jgi:hypothetical protein
MSLRDMTANTSKEYWCPIFTTYHARDEVQTAHLVAYNAGEVNCDYPFGKV